MFEFYRPGLVVLLPTINGVSWINLFTYVFVGTSLHSKIYNTYNIPSTAGLLFPKNQVVYHAELRLAKLCPKKKNAQFVIDVCVRIVTLQLWFSLRILL